jgi:hypothetical protein
MDPEGETLSVLTCAPGLGFSGIVGVVGVTHIVVVKTVHKGRVTFHKGSKVKDEGPVGVGWMGRRYGIRQRRNHMAAALVRCVGGIGGMSRTRGRLKALPKWSSGSKGGMSEIIKKIRRIRMGGETTRGRMGCGNLEVRATVRSGGGLWVWLVRRCGRRRSNQQRLSDLIKLLLCGVEL